MDSAEDIAVDVLTKAISKGMKSLERSKRSSEMSTNKEAAGILAVAKDILAGGKHNAPGHDRYGPATHIDHPTPVNWRPPTPKAPATPKVPDEAQKKQWREDAAKRRKEQGIQPRKTT